MLTKYSTPVKNTCRNILSYRIVIGGNKIAGTCGSHLVLLNHYLGEPGKVPSLSPGGLVTLKIELPAFDCGKLMFWGVPPDYEGDT